MNRPSPLAQEGVMDRINSVVRAGPTLFPTTRQPRLAADRAASWSLTCGFHSIARRQTTAPARRPGSAAQMQDAKTAALLSQLAQRDRQVRTHEAAHIAAGGMYVQGGARFFYTTGRMDKPMPLEAKSASTRCRCRMTLATLQYSRYSGRRWLRRIHRRRIGRWRQPQQWA